MPSVPFRSRADPFRVFRVLAGACWYPLALVATTIVLDAQPQARRAEWQDWASTDLHNLTDAGAPFLVHPIGSMLTSALVCEGDLLAWVVLSLVGLAAAGARLGASMAAALVVGVHVAATGISQGITGYRISIGALPVSSRSMSDVGPSYLVVAALVLGVAYGPGFWRWASTAGFVVLAPSLFGGLTDLDVAPMGHTASVVLAVGLGLIAIRYRARRAAIRQAAPRPIDGGPAGGPGTG
jgi:hypothetical protein